MTRYRKLLATLVSATIVVGLLAGGGWLLLGSAAEAQAFGLALAAHRGHDRGWHWGRHQAGARCQHLDAEYVEIAGLIAKAHLDLDSTQYDALGPVLAVVDQWRAQVATICQRELGSTDDALTALQETLATSADAVARLKPAMSTFEATLNDEQRAHLQSWVERHNRRGAAPEEA